MRERLSHLAATTTQPARIGLGGAGGCARHARGRLARCGPPAGEPSFRGRSYGRPLGEKLTQIRQQQGRTQTELAQQLGFISRAHIANLETGRDVPSLSILVRLAAHLGVTLDSLLRDARELEVFERRRVPRSPDEKVLLPFGMRLRTLRRQRHVKQWQLAQALQLGTRAYVSDLEIGRRLRSIDLVLRIADFFEMTTDALLQPDQRIADTEAALPPDEPAGSHTP